MSYLHIENLYKNTKILLFKECYAMEKINGTSSHISFKMKDADIKLFSGGSSYETFKTLFDMQILIERFKALGYNDVTVYGEAYGGKMQKMSHTYGNDLKFVAFEVKIDDTWLNVKNAHDVCNKLGLDFVDYVKIPATIEAIDIEMNKPSVQAVKNGITEPKKREGVVLRPLEEYTANNGSRIISKHKHPDFRETKTVKTVSEDQLKILSEVNEICNEWVTDMRLTHVLDKYPEADMKDISKIINEMYEDVIREGKGEIVESKELKQMIFSKTAKMFKKLLNDNLHQQKD